MRVRGGGHSQAESRAAYTCPQIFPQPLGTGNCRGGTRSLRAGTFAPEENSPRRGRPLPANRLGRPPAGPTGPNVPSLAAAWGSLCGSPLRGEPVLYALGPASPQRCRRRRRRFPPRRAPLPWQRRPHGPREEKESPLEAVRVGSGERLLRAGGDDGGVYSAGLRQGRSVGACEATLASS